MVSILGDYNYTFPKKIHLKHRLKDLLEKDVDEKYFLTQKFIDYITGVNYDNEKYDRKKAFESKFESVNGKGISGTITTREGGRSNDTFVAEQVGYIEKGTGKHQSNTIYNGENISPTLSASDAKEPVKIITVGNYGNGHHSQDVTDPKGLMPTLTTGNHNNGQVIAVKKKESEKDEKRLHYFRSWPVPSAIHL